jgi:hypothetical protein
MYRPNFCSECGKKVIRLHWHAWTSRSFCDDCAKRLRKERLTLPAIVGIVLLSIGLIAGRSGRPAPPPLIIQRAGNSPLLTSATQESTDATDKLNSAGSESTRAKAGSEIVVDENVYLCGARTKKGTPCSRRVHGPVRCWQHKGMPAMLSAEKLQVKD